MEHGRWHFRSQEFTPSDYHSPSTVRRKHRTVERRYAAAGLSAEPLVLREAQGPVWDEIAFNADALSAPSETGALDESMRRKEEDLQAWAGHFHAVHGQVGMAAFLSGRPLASTSSATGSSTRASIPGWSAGTCWTRCGRNGRRRGQSRARPSLAPSPSSRTPPSGFCRS
jgi:hypothetical protein